VILYGVQKPESFFRDLRYQYHEMAIPPLSLLLASRTEGELAKPVEVVKAKKCFARAGGGNDGVVAVKVEANNQAVCPANRFRIRAMVCHPEVVLFPLSENGSDQTPF
jgi:hypothetical protein